MKYRFRMVCPHCGHVVTAEGDKYAPQPITRCADCLMNEYKVVSVETITNP